jgi:metal-dependent HD superfamily phosphatase/phosphodiesterase
MDMPNPANNELIEPTSEPPETYVTRPDLIRLPTRHNHALAQIVVRVNADVELRTMWQVQNVNAVNRLGMSDHGPVHMQVVANIALRLARLLFEREIKPSVVATYEGFSNADAEVVIVLAALTHDLGMSIHRTDHEDFSLFLAEPIVERLLTGVYDLAPRTILRSEILHAIISHRAGGKPLTLEAGIVRVADALDMAKGRSRVAFEAGKVNIHSVSAAAIEKVEIMPGEERAIRVRILMNNSAGIFQVDELMKDKLRGSGLEPYVEVEATVEGETEKRLVQAVTLYGGDALFRRP